jgi:zinc protease
MPVQETQPLDLNNDMSRFALSGAGASPLQLPVKTYFLENGLKILVLEDPTIKNVALNFIYRVGSRNEGSGTTGLAHFFEHMMFNGSKNYGPGAFDRIMEAHGASNNAYTTKDVTVYQDWCPPEALPLIFDLEADRMAHLSIDPIMVASERGVVANERRCYMSEPEGVLDEQLFASAFTAHPYRWPVLGWMVDIQNWRISDLESFFKTYYSPNNCVMVVCGAVNGAEVYELARKKFGFISAHAAPRSVHTEEPAQLGERRSDIAFKSELTQVQLGWHVPASSHEDFWALSTLEKLMFHGQSSLFYKKFIESEVTLNISGGVDGHAVDPTLFIMRTNLRQGVSTTQFQDTLDGVMGELAEKPMPEKALQKAKNQVRAEFIRSLKTINGKADLIGAFEIFGGGHESLPQALDHYSAVTTEDVQRVVQKYFIDDNRTWISLIPERDATAITIPQGPEKVAKEAEETAAVEAPPIVIPPITKGLPSGIDFPKSERFVLENGLKVRLMERRALPLMCMAMSFEAGGLHSPEGKEGLSPMVARLLRKGTKRWTEAELSKTIDFVGGFLGMTVSKFPMTVVGEFMSEHCDLALSILNEVTRCPIFPAVEFERMQRRNLDALRNDRGAARNCIDRFFIGSLLADHPYGRPSSGNLESVGSITRDDLEAFHKRFLVPNNATLVLVGDFDSVSMKTKIEDQFSSWKPAEIESPELVTLPKLSESRVLLVEKDSGDEVVFQFGCFGIPRVHKDYSLISLLNVLLGGRFTSRLNTRLRIEEGLTYGVSSGFLDIRDTGLFRVESFSANETAERAVDLALEECKSFHSQGISQEELDSAKAYLRGQFPTDVETPEQLAEWLLFFEMRGLETSYIRQSFEQIEALELEQANGLIKEHFSLAKLQFVLIGQPQALNFAEKYGSCERVDLKTADFTPPYASEA